MTHDAVAQETLRRACKRVDDEQKMHEAKMADVLPFASGRTLGPNEENHARSWAWLNYKPEDPIRDDWHPIVQTECQKMSRPIRVLAPSVRLRKCMKRLGIYTLGQLIQLTPEELLACHNIGVTSLTAVRAGLAEEGLTLRDDC